MANTIKRHFYNEKDYIINKGNGTVELLPEFYNKLKTKNLWGKFGFKKIGGSSIGNVLKVNQFVTEFGAWASMSWLAVPIMDRKYVDAGIAIEPKVIDLIEEVTGKEVKTYDPRAYNFDFFADKDDIVGGLPDGYMPESNTILEIKTSGAKNLEKWKKYGVPAAYQKQAQLYAYLMEADSYSIVGTFLEEEDYADPSSYDIKKRKTKSWTFKTDKLQAEDDILKVKTWYAQYTATPVSPPYDLAKDSELLEYLEVKNPDEQEVLLNKWANQGKYVR